MATGTSRRQGQNLSDAILAAAWDQLSEHGYADFTLESVATRAGTSRPVLSRRWLNRADLAVAALDHFRDRHPIVVADFGSVREELVSLLRQLSRRGASAVDVVLFGMRGYFMETASSYRDLQRKMHGSSVLNDILRRAAGRGEIDAGKLTDRIAALPVDLVRHETFRTRRALPDASLFEIVDTIFLPLVNT